jgi:hypothetical protein
LEIGAQGMRERVVVYYARDIFHELKNLGIRDRFDRQPPNRPMTVIRCRQP